jgi:hypothetical protein
VSFSLGRKTITATQVLGLKRYKIWIQTIVMYRCKVMGRSPAFAAVRPYMKYVMHTEQFIAGANDNMNTFYGKWSAMLLALNACYIL